MAASGQDIIEKIRASNEIAKFRQLYLDNSENTSLDISNRSRAKHGLLRFINGTDIQLAAEARKALEVINDDGDAVDLADELLKNGKTENLNEALRLYKLSYEKNNGLDTKVTKRVIAGLNKMASRANDSESPAIQKIASEAVLMLGDIYLKKWEKVTPPHVEVKKHFKMIDHASEILRSQMSKTDDRLAFDDQVQKMKVDLLTVAAPHDVQQYKEVNYFNRKSNNLFWLSINDNTHPNEAEARFKNNFFNEAVLALKQAIKRSKNPELMVANIQLSAAIFERKPDDKTLALLALSNDEDIGPLTANDPRVFAAINEWCKSSSASSFLLDEAKRDNLFRNILLAKYKNNPNPIAIHFAEQLHHNLRNKRELKNASAVFLKLDSQFSKSSKSKPVLQTKVNTAWSVRLFSMFSTRRVPRAIELQKPKVSAANDAKLQAGQSNEKRGISLNKK